tara:strand:+ start:3663 stop:4535 length:873 start_codon:yes stop_codon:yes gene_type:complete
LKTVIIGSQGQLGSDLWKTLQANGDKVIGLSHQDLDITNKINSRNLLKRLSPELIINCAAYVQVDKAEIKPSYAFQVNSQGSLNLAKISAELGAFYTYISTDYVFDGTKRAPYDETDIPNPINIYGVSKYVGEYLSMNSCPNTLITRVSSLFGKSGSQGKGGNFIEAIINKAKTDGKLQVVNDMYISPTYTIDAATTILQLINHKTKGLVHVTNSIPSDCTWFTLAKQTLEFCKIDAQIDAISSNNYPSIANRPIYSVLDNQKAEHITGNRIPDWVDAVKRYLMEKQYIN